MKPAQLFVLIQKSPEVVLAAVVAAILGAMIIPLPAPLLDAGIALNLAASVALLVASLFARDALKVTSFPTLLLFTTLFRVALNVSSTRLALSDGHAGDIIQAFGEFVVRGDYLVGAVVFCILTLVQFLVVAKGAERVAEVSARFTLDAMPGKQMSIDADLRAGAIDQAQARRRRRDLERESQMFGAMDGAMKFVKGDVIAGLVIVLVNLFGGIAIGVLQHGLTAGEAAELYALIAIGDGLVSQIPSLAIAVAAGLVVTRVSAENDEGSLGGDIGSQFFGQPKALWVVAALCLLLALVPGMPKLIFIGVAGGFGGLGWYLPRVRREQQQTAEVAEKVAQEAAASPSPGARAGGVTPLLLDLAPDLLALVEEDGGRFVKETLERLRERLYAELGVQLPPVAVRTGAAYLPERTYAILIDEVPAGRGQLRLEGVYALSPPGELEFLQVKGTPAVDPVSGKPISLVPRTARGVLTAAQIPTRTPGELLGDHFAAVLRRRASQLLGVQEVQALLTGLEQTAPTLVKEALGKVPLPLLTEVLRKLLGEEVSVRNLRVILEALVAPATEGDSNALVEKCRQSLHRYLTFKYAPTGPLYAYLVDPAVEVMLREDREDPTAIGQLLEGVKRIASGGKAVVLAAPDIRRPLRKLCETVYPDLAVLTYSELDVDLQIRPVGRLSPVAARA
ncbi:MAG: flagellar biosynthesis protein FlhA [Myxococcota bacterium]|nr:flagellar biosynthesis protein FlhA [Myxococcota bacterium]